MTDMKKLHILPAMAAAILALSACTTDKIEAVAGQGDLNPESPSNAVAFDTYLGRTTRTDYSAGPITNGESTDANSLKSAKFGVFAYLTTADYNNETGKEGETAIVPNFMYNQKIEWSTSPEAWTYSPVKYWPNGVDTANGADPSNTAVQNGSAKKLSFFAFAPYTEKSTGDYSGSDFPVEGMAATNVNKTDKTSGVAAITNNAYTGNVWVKFLMPNATESQAVDLLWGTNGKAEYVQTDATTSTNQTIGEGYNLNLTKQTVGEKVSFLFKHALAKIGGATHSGDNKTTAGSPATCGFKVVVDVDGNSGDSQGDYFGTSNKFDSEKTLVTIKELKIQDGKSASDDTNVAVTGQSSTLNKFGWFNIETGKWSDKSGSYGNDGEGATYNVTANSDATLTNDVYCLNEKILEIGANKAGDTADNKKKSLNSSDKSKWDNGTTESPKYPTGVTTTAQPVFANEDVPGLLLIPAGDAKLYVTLDYFVRTADPNLKDGFTEVEQVITNELTLGSLDPNKFYTIIMHIGLTSVKFEAVVADWQTKSDGTYDEDGKFNEGTGATDNESSVWLPSNVVAYAASTSVEASATTAELDVTSFNIGSSLTYEYTGNATAASYDDTNKKVTVTLSKNLTNQPVVSTVFIKGTQNISFVITQDADATYTLTPVAIGKNANDTGTITVGGGTISTVTATKTPEGLSASVSSSVVTYTATNANNTGSVKTYDGIVLTISDGTNDYVYTTSITQAAE